MIMNKYINKMASLYRYATFLSSVNHNLFICILVSIILPTSERADAKVYGQQPNYDGERRLTKEYQLRQGAIRGLIVQPGRQYELQSVEMFLGIPYAAPPVGSQRFMPPGSALPWSGVKHATEFAPVCPQMIPTENKNNPLSPSRQQYMKRIAPFLENESEDCLYLNIYSPKQDYKPKKKAVLVFIQGDSFEWSSGNPYDGRVLASYGNIIVVTINFRLGILGFMKPSLTDHAYGNNGLLDQLAALKWIQDNISDLNGDPNSVTLMGHATGSACVNFLMISPIIPDGLFHRAILMSGSALSDWALTKDPMQYTIQVAQHLNCHISNNTMGCLQSKRLSDIKKVQILARKFATPLGPMVAGSFIPTEPAQTVESYPNIFNKYELLSGVAEVESYHEFHVIELGQGVIEKERDELVEQYAQVLYDSAPDVAAKEIKQEYFKFLNTNRDWGSNANRENRDSLLDVLSDGRTVAPLFKIANYHSQANSKCFFYVFGHNSEHTDYAALRKSVHGEELPYVFGVPLGGAHTHFHGEFTVKERLLSEVVMRRWTNFIKLGTPNTQRTEQYLTLQSKDWSIYNIDWPEYSVEHQSFLHIDLPPSHFVRSLYRANYTKFWNEVLPNKMKNYAVSPLFEYEPVTATTRPKKTVINKGNERQNWKNSGANVPYRPHISAPTYGRPKTYVPTSSSDDIYKEIKSIISISKPIPANVEEVIRKQIPPKDIALDQSLDLPVKSSSATMTVIITIGCLFLVVNIIIFATLYLKKKRLQARERELKADDTNEGNLDTTDGNTKPRFSHFKKFKNTCNAFNVVNWNSLKHSDDKLKNDKTEPIKTPKSDDSGGFGRRYKLRRHLSSSTIDANTKVRDWITNEIVNRSSPQIESNQKMFSHDKVYKSDDILNKSNKSNENSKDSLNVTYNKESKRKSSKDSLERSKFKISEKSTANSAPNLKSTITISKESVNKITSKPTSKSNDSISTTDSKKSNKVSVAIDATPASRNSAVLRQKPIELSKSVDIDDPISKLCNRNEPDIQLSVNKHSAKILISDAKPQDAIKFTSKIEVVVDDTIKISPQKVGEYQISHKHSASDPIKDVNYDSAVRAFDFLDIPPPSIFRNDINVTSKDETDQVLPLTPAEALLTIQRRNYPKVLPDFPRSYANQKRLSLQPNTMQSFKSYMNSEIYTKDSRSTSKTPPLPPPRTTSTLDRKVGFRNSKTSNNSSFDSGKSSFSSTFGKSYSKNDDYCNISALSSEVLQRECQTAHHDINSALKYIPPSSRRQYPQVIIAANDIPDVNDSTIIIKPLIEKSLAEIQVNAPRVRLTDSFYETGEDSEISNSSLSIISDLQESLQEEDDDASDAELIEALVGGFDGSKDSEINIPDTKGLDNNIIKKLEIIPVKVNPDRQPLKHYESYKYVSDDILPDVTDLEKTAQIKQKFSLNKLQNRSDSINSPPEKIVKLKDRKVPKTPPFSLKLNQDKSNISKTRKLSKYKTDNKKIPLEHSTSGSSNDTTSSTGTVKEVEITKK